MKLDYPFLQLPLSFDAALIARDRCHATTAAPKGAVVLCGDRCRHGTGWLPADAAAQQAIDDEAAAREQGMADKAAEFRAQGSEVYRKA